MASAKHTRYVFTRLSLLRPEARHFTHCLKRQNGLLVMPGNRFMTSGDEKKSASTGGEWRKKQLEKLEKKFTEPYEMPVWPEMEPLDIDSDEELQPMWAAMENRVKNRRPRTLRESGGKTGRINIRKTDEEIWLKEGLYDDESKKK
jgi:hypothetical protein